ncbi:MAG: bifunctional folylpolyglutamate synthase/dihydrofolate synthase [Candidatus Buchananbacteria bacterium]|nr:bifunctional folylpolyglutamate synthase/dihydrofolate synthase [Candidatus Buchananbacteria bacterium]
MKNNFEKYFSAVQYLESITNISQDDYFVKKGGRSIFLKRTKYLLNVLGNPQKGLKYIHVGGTSGKGSVSNMIQSILVAAGNTTGLFTSPFPTTSIEKIKVNNRLISPDEFAALVEKIKPAIDQTYLKSRYGRPSYFEIFTAIGFLYFKEKKCEYVVLEVGLGGRHDATNIIDSPAVTVINKIGFDHTEILGNDIKSITREKAAIIKPKTKLFTVAYNAPEALKIISQACKKQKAYFNLVDAPAKRYPLKLLGQHQQYNAELAAQVARTLGISDRHISTGLKNVTMSCRTEIIQKNPLVILDGAHNESKIKTTLEIIKHLTYKKLYLIIALTKERNPKEVFGEISKHAHKIFITRQLSLHRKAYPPKKLGDALKCPKKIKVFLDPQMALESALSQATKNDLVLVTGSFYLAGQLRKNWRSEQQILKERKI